MNLLKKTVAILLTAVFVFSLSACHPKDEVAISSGDYKITSAMYSYYLVMADADAKQLINSSDKYDTKADGFKYIDQTIEGKKYTDYVKEKALESCLRYITIAKLCDEADLELEDDKVEEWKGTAQYYWNYAYGAVFAQNGIAYSTYEKILLNEALYNAYFDYLYLEGGEKEMAKADIQKNLDSHYSAVYIITHDYSDQDEPDLDKIKQDLEKYKKLFEKGKTYDEVKAEYDADQKAESDSSNPSSSTGSTSSNTSSTGSDTSSESKEEEKKPLDEDIVILTDNENSNTSGVSYFEKYSEVAKMKEGEVALIADSDNKVVSIVVKKNINADAYYFDTLSGEIVYMVNGEGFDSFLKDEAKKIDYTANDYAVNQFKVKKIKDGSEQ
ncbi:MAG: hypothetical protein E7540_00745 [Ruminococcaceae bacterium]|nr:hypothetical protein [Oscillospiraceae bacterium]